MHKRMSHPVATDQAEDTNKSPQVSATPEQLEDLRNFVASLVNSLASHAGVLFNSITSEVKGLNEIVIQTQEKVETLLKLDSQPSSSNSKIITTESQPPLSTRNQPSTAPSESSERPSVEMERSIEQILEEFPAYSEPFSQNREEEEHTPICQEVDTPFLHPRKFANKVLKTGEVEEVPVSNSFSGLPSEPSEFSESSEDSVVEHMAVMKENLSRGL